MNTKDIYYFLCSLLLCVCFAFTSVTCEASVPQKSEAVYAITETELRQLETNLDKLEQISEVQKTELVQVKKNLDTLQIALNTSQAQLNQAEISLQTVNELLKKSEQEEKSKRLKIKAQRNLWACIASTLLIIAVAK